MVIRLSKNKIKPVGVGRKMSVWGQCGIWLVPKGIRLRREEKRGIKPRNCGKFTLVYWYHVSHSQYKNCFRFQ